MTIENPMAFPSDPLISPPECRGITLRDYFAGQVIAGFAAQCDTAGTWSWTASDAATQAYAVADALLAARTKGPEA